MYSLKYNRTYHFPWSKGATNDDKIVKSQHLWLFFKDHPIIITEKMDGSNTSLEHTGCYARTHSGPPTHLSFDGLKALHAQVKHKIPEGVQLFGEWCYARHSIEYTELPDYFMLFNVRIRKTLLDQGYWASWEEVEMWAEEIGVPTVPVLFKGKISSEEKLKSLIELMMLQPSCCGGIREGVVARIQPEFQDKDFNLCVLKCVRENHVNTSDHWRNQEIIKNKLKQNSNV